MLFPEKTRSITNKKLGDRLLKGYQKIVELIILVQMQSVVVTAFTALYR